LNNAGKPNELADDYSLVEVADDSTSVIRGYRGAGGDLIAGEGLLVLPTTANPPKVLPHNEAIMDAVACWNGTSRRFYVKKKSIV